MNKYNEIKDKHDKLKPVLFNTDMVMAILDGQKTQTRRPIKSPSGVFQVCWRNIDPDNKWVEQVDENEMPTDKGVNPPYQPGDILYVRENWKIEEIDYSGMEMKIKYEADEIWEILSFESERFQKFRKYYIKNGWQPNIFMPKEASRIFLKVTDIRIQRIQHLTGDDAKAEGISKIKYAYGGHEWVGANNKKYTYPKDAFKSVWDSLYEEDGYSWKLNPWVWVIEFERMEVD